MRKETTNEDNSVMCISLYPGINILVRVETLFFFWMANTVHMILRRVRVMYIFCDFSVGIIQEVFYIERRPTTPSAWAGCRGFDISVNMCMV